MRINMVRSILRIIFDDEENSILPVRRIRYCFNHSSQREIIVGHVRLRRASSGTSTGSVISGQVNNLERREITPAHKLLKLLQPDISAGLIGNREVVSRILATGITVERRLGGAIANRLPLVFVWHRLSKLTVVAKRQSFRDRCIPEITRGRLIHVTSFVWTTAI